MDDNVHSFPKKVDRPEDWPWCRFRDMIQEQVASGELPEGAAEAVTARMKPDVLRWIDRTQEVSAGICSEETRAQLVELVAEMLTDRLVVEMDFERRRA